MHPADDNPDFVVTVTLIVADIARSAAFYCDVLGATVLREGAPAILRLKNTGLSSTSAEVRRPTTSRKLR
jgi:catechol 2,3-dioxygenase-like lactoylglutathione lyase family enzyme